MFFPRGGSAHVARALAEELPATWTRAEAWWERMRRWAARCERLLVLSASQVERAVSLLGVDPDSCVVVPNGFDPDRFRRHPVDRAAFWRHELAEDPQGW